jgi:hypothetical protein
MSLVAGNQVMRFRFLCTLEDAVIRLIQSASYPVSGTDHLRGLFKEGINSAWIKTEYRPFSERLYTPPTSLLLQKASSALP